MFMFTSAEQLNMQMASIIAISIIAIIIIAILALTEMAAG